MKNHFRHITATHYKSNRNLIHPVNLVSLIEVDLPFALSRGELFLVYQPIVDIFTGTIVSYEALIRWQHPSVGIISPGLFIPIAENTGYITAIDLWVLETVINLDFDGIPVHVNLSGYDLSQPGIIHKIEDLIKGNKDKIVLEFTETAQINFSEQLISDIKSLGVILAVDDFGTGYSSMFLLNTLKVNLLKIDIHFVQNMLLDIDSAVIVESIIRLGQSLNMEVIAEGVETIEQLHHLYRIGCKLIQGFHISRPILYEDISSFDPRPFKLSPQEKYIHDNEDFFERTENKARIMLELDDQLNYIRLTDNFCAYLGYDIEYLKSQSFMDLVAPESKEYFSLAFGQLLTNYYVDNVVVNLIRKDWTLRSTLFTARYNPHESGSVIVYLEDYTYYQDKLNEISGVYNAYSIMFHEGPLATIVWNSHYTIVDWNKESEFTFGWNKEETLGKNIIKLLANISDIPHTKTFESVFTEKRSDFILNNVTKEGSSIRCRWNNRALSDADGNIQFILSMVTDITDNLKKSDNIRMLSMAIDKSESAVVITDAMGIIEYTNEYFNQVSGYTEGLIGQNINLISSHEQSKDYYKELWNTIEQGKTWHGKFHNRKKNGDLYWCTASITPIKNDINDCYKYIGIQQDMSNILEKEKSNAILRQKLIEVEGILTQFQSIATLSEELERSCSVLDPSLSHLLAKKKDYLISQPSFSKISFDVVNEVKELLDTMIESNGFSCHLEFECPDSIRLEGSIMIMRFMIYTMLQEAFGDVQSKELHLLTHIRISLTKVNHQISFVIKYHTSDELPSISRFRYALLEMAMSEFYNGHFQSCIKNASKVIEFTIPLN